MLGLGPPWIADVSSRAFPGFKNYYLIPTPPPPPPNPGPQLSQTCSVGCGTHKPQAPHGLGFLVQMERAAGGVAGSPPQGQAGAERLGPALPRSSAEAAPSAKLNKCQGGAMVKAPPEPQHERAGPPCRRTVRRATQRGWTAPWLRAQTVVQIPPLLLASDQFLTC